MHSFHNLITKRSGIPNTVKLFISLESLQSKKMSLHICYIKDNAETLLYRSELTRKPNSVLDGYSSGIYIAVYPHTTYPETQSEQPCPTKSDASLFCLSSSGVYIAGKCHHFPRWSLTPPFHPYHNKLWRFVFCCTFRCLAAPGD